MHCIVGKIVKHVTITAYFVRKSVKYSYSVQLPEKNKPDRFLETVGFG